MGNTTVHLTCPTCGQTAVASLVWNDPGGGHPEVAAYLCPTGCHVDDETIRQIVGSSST